MQQKKIQF